MVLEPNYSCDDIPRTTDQKIHYDTQEYWKFRIDEFFIMVIIVFLLDEQTDEQKVLLRVPGTCLNKGKIFIEHTNIYNSQTIMNIVTRLTPTRTCEQTLRWIS